MAEWLVCIDINHDFHQFLFRGKDNDYFFNSKKNEKKMYKGIRFFLLADYVVFKIQDTCFSFQLSKVSDMLCIDRYSGWVTIASSIVCCVIETP